MADENSQGMRDTILKQLSVDARISMKTLSGSTGGAKGNAYGLFNKVVEEYGLRFVPEISIENLWKWEFIKKARMQTKRGIITEAMDAIPITGFGEYLMLVKFIGAAPDDEKIVEALGTSYSPQFATRLKGNDHDLLVYVVARSYEDAVELANSFGKKLGKHRMVTHIDRVWGKFGFFPLNEKVISQFDIFDSYKNLLIGLNGSGRDTFSEIGRKAGQGPAQMLYAYDRLVRTGIMKRITYYEDRPKGGINLLLTLKTVNPKSFDETKDAWFMKLIREYERAENECVFMCDTASPRGMLVIASFQSAGRAGKFVGAIRSTLKGVVVSRAEIGGVLMGHLGIRDFDMRYTQQYRSLAIRRLVPRIAEKGIGTVSDNPDAF
jgi:DNA-binding Lrp family transcriptional regulator